MQLFTGQPPTRHRVETDDVTIDGRTPMLTELLREAGYSTAGFWTGWFLAPEYGFQRGFQVYRNMMNGGQAAQDSFEAALAEGELGGVWQAQGALERRSHTDVNSPNVARAAAEVLDGLEADEPLFLFAHFFDPHYDYVPPGEWATRFDPDYRGSITGRDFWVNPRIWDEATEQRVVGDRDLQHLRALYRGEIGWTDESVGQLIDDLERTGRLDDTLIVITSDHGEEFFDHGRRGHKQSLYDEVLRVPLLVVLPEHLRKGVPRVVDRQVSLSDVMPTILDYAGVRVPDSVLGRSLRPALEGRDLPSRPIVSSMHIYRTDGQDWTVFMHESVREEHYKLWRVTGVSSNAPPELLFVGYFDLAADPLEQAGRTPDQDPRARAAWDVLEAELARQRAHFAKHRPQDPAERTTDIATVVASELKGLGYVDGEDTGAETPARLVPWGLGMRPPLEMPGR